MRKLVAVLIAVFFITGAGLALAEGMKGEHKMDSGKRLERLTKELTLTTDQQTKVAAILKADEPQMQAVMDKMMADKKAIMDASDQKIEGVLTPDQVKKYEQMKAEHQKKMDKEKNEKEDK
jgi:Spy/CpxP family protein refolding chaperone